MKRQSYKFHPQLSSISKIDKTLDKFDVQNNNVLDCFCGTGTIILSAINHGAKYSIGSDLENYNQYIRTNLRKFIDSNVIIEPKKLEFCWGIDAIESVKRFNFDILICDPPNPKCIVGGTPLSMCRDTGLSGNELRKFWKERMNDKNIMGKNKDTIEYVKKIINICLDNEKTIIMNLFKSGNFDYHDEIGKYFNTNQIYDSYYEVFL